ncbi:MAG TPA: serine/threonine-protein kinase [Pyrinomonadaceae bacterium]|nr:serine/threonine-protein kinase [Pyrinomonadaceae bacterium]
MADHDLTGQILDGKYQMTRELGKGGMGTVYLATHLGTERPVAVKIIAPQFMQRAEFVERFRREAKAAGRLRHPNVVDVTDFGFASTSGGEVAYLVMEYLDGCTLGEILDEEQNLPVGWTLDILEQVCSAVQEAHNMGIIHRDLKPDNIWLEPNQRGGYTVKVLDFGIAKLEEHEAPTGDVPEEFLRSSPTQVGSAKTTMGGVGDTFAAEASTIVQTVEHNKTISLDPIPDNKKTAIYDQDSDQDTVGTQLLGSSMDIDIDRTGNPTGGDSRLVSQSTAGLTRVGAVLGTPLYMSPEQCRGEHLDARSDIYSLGVIAYQMLSGKTPFEGDFKDVMESHKTLDPPPLAAKKVRRKMKRVIHEALSKDPINRPQSAEAFASEMRAREEGIYGLVSRAMVIYSQHLLKFLTLTAFLVIPACQRSDAEHNGKYRNRRSRDRLDARKCILRQFDVWYDRLDRYAKHRRSFAACQASARVARGEKEMETVCWCRSIECDRAVRGNRHLRYRRFHPVCRRFRRVVSVN